MSVWFIIASAALLLLCVLLVTIILLQKKRSSGLSGAITGMGGGQTFWDKNKGRSLDGQLEKYTKICGALFIILSLILNIIK